MEKTKATENLSQWFSLSEQKPWVPGVYEVREEFDIGTNQKWYSYWNGKKFMYYTHISEHDAFEKKSHATGCITTHWRGLSSDPSAKPKARGNRKVTRYVVTLFGDVVATYENKRNAYLHANRNPSSRVQKLRFRSPEAS
jgi:hypothetical protein